MPKPKRQYDALELSLSRRFSKNWFGSAELHPEPAVRQLLRPGQLGRDPHADDRCQRRHDAAVGRQHRPRRQQRTLGVGHRRAPVGSHGNLDVLGRLATDRPHVVKLYGAYTFPFGTQVGAFFYGGSGTPISTVGDRSTSSSRCSSTAAATWAARPF